MKNLLEPARDVGIESHRNPWKLMGSPRTIRLFQHKVEKLELIAVTCFRIENFSGCYCSKKILANSGKFLCIIYLQGTTPVVQLEIF